MSDLDGNHIVGFSTRRLICLSVTATMQQVTEEANIFGQSHECYSGWNIFHLFFKGVNTNIVIP